MANCEDFCKVVYAFSRYVPTGGEVDTSMTPQEYRKLLEICDAKYKAYQAAGCNCGNCHITIASNGDIMACRRVMDSKVGNVFEDRLADGWICQMERYRDYMRWMMQSRLD